MLYFSHLSYMISSRNIIEQVFLTNQKLKMNMPQIFENKICIKFQKMQKQKKSLDLMEQKLVKLNKTEKTEELIAQYEEVECLWNVLSLSCKDRNLPQMALTNPSKRFDVSGKLFWKQALRGVVENVALKF